jgi:hypothetical protein
MFLTIDIIKIDVLVVDGLELDVLGARRIQQPVNKLNNQLIN